MKRGACTELEATEVANNKCVPLVVEQQRKFESMLESFDVRQSELVAVWLRDSMLVVRSFVLCGQGSSLLWTPALRPYSGPVRLPRERKGIGRCVRCVLATCGEGRLSRSEQLVGYLYSTPLLDVAYCLA